MKDVWASWAAALLIEYFTGSSGSTSAAADADEAAGPASPGPAFSERPLTANDLRMRVTVVIEQML